MFKREISVASVTLLPSGGSYTNPLAPIFLVIPVFKLKTYTSPRCQLGLRGDRVNFE